MKELQRVSHFLIIAKKNLIVFNVIYCKSINKKIYQKIYQK